MEIIYSSKNCEINTLMSILFVSNIQIDTYYVNHSIDIDLT